MPVIFRSRRALTARSAYARERTSSVRRRANQTVVTRALERSKLLILHSH
jgi:hypothetical protein